MRDLATHLDEPVVERLLRDIAKLEFVTLMIVGPHAEVPSALRIHSAVFQLPKPDVTLIDSQVRTIVRQLSLRSRVVNELNDAQLTELVRALRGLTLEEVDSVVSRLIADDGRLSLEDIPGAIKSKGSMIAKTGVLELVTPEFGLEWVAGFDALKAWAATRSKAFDHGAEAFGIEPPRGFLLTGVPGCGKSFVVKSLAHDWGMPLLHLDAGSLYDKFVGQSERNLREALATAEALAPSMLWIDEIEKGFGATGPSESDGGLSYRLLGTLATWMQERTAHVFVAATSNDITLLPPELTRQGRFDEIFFVDLPHAAERAHLFALQLARRNRDHRTFDCAAMAAASEGFSGSEIEQAIVNALYTAYAAGRDLTSQDVLDGLAVTRPLTTTSPGKIEAIRAWGRSHAREA
jgi:AAA+ superfamily predicted ATPase